MVLLKTVTRRESVIGTVAYRYAFAMQDATERSEITNCYFADGNLEVKNAHEAAVAKSLTEMKQKILLPH